MYLIRPPKAYRWLFGKALFRKDPEHKVVYLTFDDGPHDKATPAALLVLESYGVQATFFMLGKNALKYPNLVDTVRGKGHQIGNHGMAHLNGWATTNDRYVADTMEGKELIGSDLFRPAYGKLSMSQYMKLAETEQIVFWDVISGDFDTSIDSKKVVENVVNNVRNGSIIVMHDSQKAMKTMKESLGKIIVELKKEGYEFGTL